MLYLQCKYNQERMTLMKKKQRKALFDSLEFSSSDYAREIYEKESKKLKFKFICCLISLLTSLCFLIILLSKKFPSISAFIDYTDESIFLNVIFMVLMGSGWIALIISNFFMIFKLIWHCAWFGWFIIPFYFIDILGLIFGAVFGLYACFFTPVIPCIIGTYQTYKNKKDAEDFLVLINATECGNV